MDLREMEETLNLRFAGSPRAPARARRALDSLNGALDDVRSEVDLLVSELITNSVLHSGASHGAIELVATAATDRVRIEVYDEGPGFDRTGVPDPTLEENLTRCCGRGILLMEAYMSQVKWSRGGRRVRMIRKNQK